MKELIDDCLSVAGLAAVAVVWLGWLCFWSFVVYIPIHFLVKYW